jgi:hypothetical protein
VREERHEPARRTAGSSATAATLGVTAGEGWPPGRRPAGWPPWPRGWC